MAVHHFSQDNDSHLHNMGSNAFHEPVLEVTPQGPSLQMDLSSLVTNSTNDNGSGTPFNVITRPPCQWILTEDIADSRVRIWDLIILVPNVLFICFLLYRSRIAVAKLRNSSSPIFAAFYVLVCIVAVISILRCVVAMTVNAAVPAGDYADKVLWLILRFFLLATELSVVIFGLAFGHLDSKTSIKRVLAVTTLIALAYSITQGTLEFLHPDPTFRQTNSNGTDNFDIFAHGGMIFWASSSLFFFVVYTFIFLLPWTCLKTLFSLPTKRSFYYYALFLALLNMVQAIGSLLIYFKEANGQCVVDVTTYIYFTLYDPLVYGTFLREFFSISQPSISFSYKHQVDDILEEDTVSMPYQNAFGKAPEDLAFSSSFDSTHFDRQPSSMESPQNSLTGPSLSLNSDYHYEPEA